MFADPSWGGNREKSGWKLLGFDDRAIWQSPFGFYDANPGERLYRARVGGGGAFTASPVASDGRLFMASEDGDIFVIQAGREYLELGKYPMNEVVMASPAISNGLLLVRTLGHVWAVGR